MSAQGEWISLNEPVTSHTCVLPTGQSIRFHGVHPGSIWQCVCGQTWEFAGWTDHGHDTMPGEDRQTPNWLQTRKTN